ncbi:phenazine biosynthesis-like domain-containing protein isoform X2 [Limulus polyphemus]|uniref:Phenazine biosynthesis-like domain-containing protein isoform X2 n=1 Tax=Limulus polyphemus TaxID=6850 RepID=A0ABM1T0C5_LIMPO|nr:phenazine biosynthesis-like domain-containing protein isoform X2 [Limulus polyphemus]
MDDGVKLFTVDAFTAVPFKGNPAAVCLIENNDLVPDDMKQKIATEMNLSETAFVLKLMPDDEFKTASKFLLQWFTPTNEVPLCGHATLASAAVLFNCYGNKSEVLAFETLSGTLYASRQEQKVFIDLPLNSPEPMLTIGNNVPYQDLQYSHTTKKLLIRLKDCVTRKELENLTPQTELMVDAVPSGKVKGVIITLRGFPENGCSSQDGKTYDFVSRYFAPWNGIDEDPVTGSAHTVLGPYWSKELNKTPLYAHQCSARGGDLYVNVRSDGRVDIGGDAVIVLKAKLFCH